MTLPQPDPQSSAPVSRGCLRELLRRPEWALTLVLVPLLQWALYGINYWAWLHYGFEWLPDMGPEALQLDPLLSFVNNHSPPPRVFVDRLIENVFRNGVVYFMCSYVLRLLQLLACYTLFCALLGSRSASFIGVLLLSFSLNSVGLFSNGLFRAPAFYAGSIAGLVSLLAILLFVRGHIVVSALTLAAAANLHTPDTAGVVMLVAAWIVALAAIDPARYWQRCWRFLLALGLGLVPILRALIGDGELGTVISIRDWYSFIVVRDPDDVTLLYTLFWFGMPALFACACAFLVHRQKRAPEHPMWAGGLQAPLRLALALYLLVMVVEAAHLAGWSFGLMSEIFVAAQFRRAFWLLGMFSIPLVCRAIVPDLVSLSGAGRWLLWGLAVVVIEGGYFKRNLDDSLLSLGAAGLLVIMAGLLARKGRSPGFYFWLSAALVPLLALARHLPAVAQIVRPADARHLGFPWESIVLVVTLGTFAFPLGWLQRRSVWGRRRLAVMAVAASVLAMPVYNLVHSSFSTARGIAAAWPRISGTVDYESLYAETFHRGRPIDDTLDGAWQRAARHLRELAGELSDQPIMLIADPTLTLNLRHASGLPLYLFENTDRWAATYSRRYASEYDRRLQTLFGHGIDYFYVDRGYAARFREAYAGIGVRKLRAAADGLGGVLLLTTSEVAGLAPIYEDAGIRGYWVPSEE